MAWKDVVVKSLTVDELEQHVGSLKMGVWRPRFVVVHNTSVPDRKTWDGWQARNPPITDEKWGHNLVSFYKGLGVAWLPTSRGDSSQHYSSEPAYNAGDAFPILEFLF